MGVATFVAILMAVLIAMLLPFAMLGSQWREAEEKARVRRLAEHKMNARLLRFDI